MSVTHEGVRDFVPADRLLVEAKRWTNPLRFAAVLLFFRAPGRFPRAPAEVDGAAVTRMDDLASLEAMGGHVRNTTAEVERGAPEPGIRMHARDVQHGSCGPAVWTTGPQKRSGASTH